jgi:carbonic anhydrase/acetyltransferase-like protein (isoleucine patch superfamily)
VISGVSIGNGSIIGAGSVVSRDVPPFGIAVGAPARVVRMRFDDAIIERIQASAWWSWSPEEIRAKEGLFTGAVTPELLDEFLEAEGS